MILTEKQQNYQHYCLKKWINMYLTGEEILPSNQRQRQIIEQLKTEERVGSFISLDTELK